MLSSVFYIFIFFIGLTNTEGNRRLNLTRSRRDNVCRTRACLQAAEMIKKNLNINVNPCDDFYRFACGGYISRTQLSPTTLGINSFLTIKESMLQQLLEILSEDIAKNDTKPFRMAKQFFNDCMDEETILRHGLTPIMQKIRQLGGWPVADETWEPAKFSCNDIIQNAREIGFSGNYLLSFDIETNFLNSSRRTIYVGPPDLGLPAFNLKRGIADSRVQMYYRLMVGVAVKLGVPIKQALVQLATMLLFEMKLAESFPTSFDRKEDINKTFVPMTVQEAQRRFPTIKWKKFLQSMLGSSVSLPESATIVVVFPEFVNKLDALLRDANHRTLANYLIWRMIFFSLNSYLLFSDTPRWKSCVAATSEKLELAVGAMYIRKFIKKGTKEKVLKISSDICDRIYDTLSKSTWIDQKTRKNALNKIKAITSNVAYHDALLDDRKLEDVYQNLHLEPHQYYESLLSIKRFKINLTISTLNLPVLKNDWFAYESALAVNAFYSLPENSIKIPAAILQKNIFEPDRPSYLNYGAIGFIIGHELSHAFDIQGSEFDDNGFHRDWWSPQTKMKYLDRVQCFVEQYNAYTLEGIPTHLNGEITQAENIADNEGIRAAYYAYKKWAKENGREPKLPGLNYSPEQLFWIGSANVWCAKYQPKYSEEILNNDMHSPEPIRVIGSVSNQVHFAKDFNCPVGSPMNPKEKCSLWT